MTTVSDHVPSQALPPVDPSRGAGPRPGSSWRWWLAVGLALLAGVAAWGLFRPVGDPQQRLRQGLSLLEAGEGREAYRLARQLQSNADSRPEGDLLAGAILLRSGQFGPALETLAGPVKHESTAGLAQQYLAEAYYRQDRWGESVRAAQEALKHDPNNQFARRWLAVAAYDLGAVGLAAEELLKLGEADPRDGRSYRLLGLIEKDREQFATAVDYYSESLRRQPDPSDRDEILEELGESLLKLNRFDEALKVLEPLPETVSLLNLRATCQAGVGDSDGQAASLARARELAPTDLKTLVASAARSTSDGDLEGAIGWLRRAVENHPHDSQAHYQFAQALERSGAADEAKEQFRLFEQWRATEQEFTELHNTANEDPGNAKLRLQLGDLALKLSKPELAATWYRAALALDPRLDPARRALEKLSRQSPR